eukprot:CAMPEP_0176475542 /NCGR_PEP_ID=MMETSP0127-20121128/43662_1 /TAXON_ID=938130 /ORGANISM="Platyophrya macrostoma, Strain WH" /LENGTH=100 /DNA_ID=CAMNT_0017871145 /DNA_START=216 /DNA_END=518 /DNA_ORIENTATION=+
MYPPVIWENSHFGHSYRCGDATRFEAVGGLTGASSAEGWWVTTNGSHGDGDAGRRSSSGLRSVASDTTESSSTSMAAASVSTAANEESASASSLCVRFRL